MDMPITSCKCGQALTPPEQFLLSQNKPVYCRKCGMDILSFFNKLLDLLKTPINVDDILCKPEIETKHFCLTCPSFQYGMCCNEKASIVVNEKEIKLIGYFITLLPKEGCRNGKE